MSIDFSFETLGYEERAGVAYVTLNRPDRLNAFNSVMQRELRSLWRGLRRHDDVRCIVLTGAGEKAFCTGIDRMEQMGGEGESTFDAADAIGSGSTPFMFNDPGDNIGPKSCDLWKPVIAAVNGMACGGAFYMLGEVEFIIAAEQRDVLRSPRDLRDDGGVRADPHVRDHAVHRDHADLAPRQLRTHVGRSARTTSAWSRKSHRRRADRARATWAAEAIASQPALAIEGTVRAIWGARELGGRQALNLGYAYVAMGTNPDSIAEGQKAFESGKRIDWRLR